MIYQGTTKADTTAAVLIRQLAELCGEDRVYTSHADLFGYGKDGTDLPEQSFSVLVKPSTTKEVAGVMRICNERRVPVTPRGGGSGVTGGALPIRGGVVISLERMDKIITINREDAYVVAEAGVRTAVLCEAVRREGWYFPVLPSSGGSSMLGGNIAENAGCIHSCKYGKMDRYVMNLELALPSGEVIWTGANVEKSSSGLNLTQLVVGSEGVLGIVTTVVLRLVRPPAAHLLMLAGLPSLEAAIGALDAMRQHHIRPALAELVCRNALDLLLDTTERSFPLTEPGVGAQLLIGLEGDRQDVERQAELVYPLLNTEDVLVAETEDGRRRLWDARLSIGTAMTADGNNYRDIDVCVPFSSLHAYLSYAENICKETNTRLVCFGHAWEGNVHVMLLRNGSDEMKDLSNLVSRLFRRAVESGGVLSGEHGIGYLQKEFMSIQFSPPHLDLMRGIKTVFDPNGILNPGKIFPEIRG